MAEKSSAASTTLTRVVTTEEGSEKGDVAIGGRAAGQQLELGAGEVEHPAETGEAAADDHRGDRQRSTGRPARRAAFGLPPTTRKANPQPVLQKKPHSQRGRRAQR